MGNRVKLYISAFFYYCGLIKLIRWWTQRSRQCLIILFYHQAAGKELRRQLLYLRRHYRILPLETALEELRQPQKGVGKKKDRRTLLALTFDDGYRDNYTHAFPLVCELETPITIFLVPGHMESGNSFWWADRLIRLAQVAQVSIRGQTYSLDRQEECKALAKIIDDDIKKATSNAEREQKLTAICEELGVPLAEVRGEPAPLLTWDQVQEMAQSGLVSFGAHTVHHPDLERLNNPSDVQHEVGECRTMLEQQLGHSINIFAYPYGRIGDYGLSAVEQAGYKWAFTTISRFNSTLAKPHLLHRIKVDSDMHMLMVAAEASGLWSFLSRQKRIVKPLYYVVRHAIFMWKYSGSSSSRERNDNRMKAKISLKTPSQGDGQLIAISSARQDFHAQIQEEGEK